jgi:hypothetical protein
MIFGKINAALIRKNIFCNLNTIIILISITVIGFILRAIFTPWQLDMPSSDSIIFFREAYNFSNGEFGELSRRILWPLIISFVFIFFKSDNISNYIDIMQIMSIFISSITIPVVYFFAKHFVRNKYAFIAAGLFAIEPNIINNSNFTLTEPLFIFMGILSLYFVLKFNLKGIIIGVIFMGLAFDTRLNAIILPFIFVLVLIFKIRPKNEIFKSIIIGMPILILIISPYYIGELNNVDSNFESNLTSFTSYNEKELSPHLYNFDKTILMKLGIIENISPVNNLEQITTADVYWLAFLKEVTHIIKVLIPFLIFTVPFGLYYISRKPNFQKKILIFTIILYCIIILPQYTISAELRNLLFLIPIFCVVSTIFLENKIEKFRTNKIILISILMICISTSLIVLYEEKQDIELTLEKESFGKFVANNYSGKIMGDLSQHVEYNLIELNEIPIKQSEKIQIINPYFIISTYENLEKYMKDNKISYVIIDDSLNNRFPMFEHIFYYEKEYPNLEKVFDSKNEFNFLKVKIFKMNLKEK